MAGNTHPGRTKTSSGTTTSTTAESAPTSSSPPPPTSPASTSNIPTSISGTSTISNDTTGSSSPSSAAASDPPPTTTTANTLTVVTLLSGTTSQYSDEPTTAATASSSSSPAAAAASSPLSPPGTTTSTITTSSTSNLNVGAIAGGAIGGAVVLALLILGFILCRRARRRKHIAPSSEFAETIKRGELPVLRLDCGVEIVPSAVHHHIPLPLKQDSYYTSPAMSDMKLPDGMGGSDEQSVRYSLEKPLQPLRRNPVQQDSNEFMKMGQAPARRVSSIGSSQEFWSRDAGKFDIRKDYRSISPLPITDASYAPLMQNTYPMEPSGAVDTLQNAYADLWNLSVAPITQSRPGSAGNGAGTQPLPPLVPVRRSVDVSQRRRI